MAPADLNPADEYASRRERWAARQRLDERRFIQIGNARLTIGLIAVAMAWFVFARDQFSVWWLLVPLAVFIFLIVWHQRVLRERTLAGRAARYYDRGLARLRDEWAGSGPDTGERFRNTQHVYSEDLDLFGKGSLFELLSTARTAAGEVALSEWLREPATRELTLSRQAAVKELQEKLDLREAISLLGDDVRAGVDAESLTKWGSLPAVKFPAGARILAPALAIAGIVTLLGLFLGIFPSWPFLAVLFGGRLFAFSVRKQVASITGAIHTPERELNILVLLLARLEQERFETPLLREILAFLPVSKRVHRLRRWVEWLDSCDHPLIRIIGLVLLWQQQIAMGIERWRERNGREIGQWIRAVGEFEALSSIAALAFERPAWSFPDLSDQAPAQFAARSLRHPLIPHAKCVPNDVVLDSDVRLLLVSGSNMSGKSTLLRSIGLNGVLAWAGAPVAAESLRISNVHIGASIRTTDSLQDNRSRFMAEIIRIRQIVDLAKQDHAVLFLLDELLGGTNSHDRLIGASGIVRGLLAGNTIGLVTTHDLALTQIEHAQNVHFADSVKDGQLEFDYRLRPGVVTRSNALALMRAVGLDV